jgi:hypothetical protein
MFFDSTKNAKKEYSIARRAKTPNRTRRFDIDAPSVMLTDELVGGRPMLKPIDGEVVWIEYPQGRHFRAAYHAANDTFTEDGQSPIDAKRVANWSRQEHEDNDISDQPTADDKGKLTRS